MDGDKGVLTVQIGKSGSMDLHRILAEMEESGTRGGRVNVTMILVGLTEHDVSGADKDDVEIIRTTDVRGPIG
jgi:hypothetical protein